MEATRPPSLQNDLFAVAWGRRRIGCNGPRFLISEKTLDPEPNMREPYLVPVPIRGAFAIVISAGRDAVTGGAVDETVRKRTAKSLCPDAFGLASSSEEAKF